MAGALLNQWGSRRRRRRGTAECRTRIESAAILPLRSGRQRPASRTLGGPTFRFHSRRTAVLRRSPRRRGRPVASIIQARSIPAGRGSSSRPRNLTTPTKRRSLRWWRHTTEPPPGFPESPHWWRHHSARPIAKSYWLSVEVGTTTQHKNTLFTQYVRMCNFIKSL